MFVCGIEEPLGENGQLYALNEDSNRLVLSTFEDAGLNRYSFLWNGDEDDSWRGFSPLAQFLVDSTNQKATWFNAWENISGFGKIRMLALKSKRIEEGWSIHSDDSLVIASKLVAETGFDGFGPPYYGCPAFYGMFLILGDITDPSKFLHLPARSSVEMLAKRHRMTPSSQFLLHLRDERLAVVYCNRHHLGYWGIIVVSPFRLNIAELMVRNLISSTKSGSEACNVWGFANPFRADS